MANATATIQEISFDVRDEQMTHVYVLVRAGGDAPIGVQGWHYKAFPARITAVQILVEHFRDHLLWPLKAPDDTALQKALAELEQARTERNIMAREAALIAQLRTELAAERERAERAEGEAAGLRQGYAELQAAVAQANTELAAACAVIAGIQAHGGWAEARIKEAIGDE